MEVNGVVVKPRPSRWRHRQSKVVAPLECNVIHKCHRNHLVGSKRINKLFLHRELVDDIMCT